MCEDIHAKLLLARLDESHIGKHTLVFEGAREFCGDGGVGVKTRERDQLENETIQESANMKQTFRTRGFRTHAWQCPR